MTEEQPYEVVEHRPDFELRRYPSHVVAEVSVSGSMASAGNRAFRLLFGYISGKNTSRESIAMTAPVVQQRATSERIAMTAPVVQTATEDGEYVVAFVLPESMSAENAPAPTSAEITIRTVPECLAAVVNYTGRWTEAGYRKHLAELQAAVDAAGLVTIGAPRWARFDPPFKPWFLRHNEVLQDVKAPVKGR